MLGLGWALIVALAVLLSALVRATAMPIQEAEIAVLVPTELADHNCDNVRPGDTGCAP